MAMDFGGLPVKAGCLAVINCGKLCENGRFFHYDKTFHFLYIQNHSYSAFITPLNTKKYPYTSRTTAYLQLSTSSLYYSSIQMEIFVIFEEDSQRE
jgi:hypothetical protein